CDQCIKNNLLATVKYYKTYGPRYIGTLKLSQFSQWDTLISKGEATDTDKSIISAMSQNEANLDGIQAYDSEILTAGAMQKTINPKGQGEFAQQVYEFKQQYPAAYKHLFEDCVWIGSSRKIMSYKGVTGEALKKALRQDFSTPTKSLQSSKALGPLVCAIRSPLFQLKQIQDFIYRLNNVVLKIVPIGYKFPIINFLRTDLGRATVLDQHVNHPGYVATDFAAALNYTSKSYPDLIRGPYMEWSHSYERILLEYYGTHRRMTDAVKKYNNLKNQLPLP
ncbi:unnamed protein product, partial [Rotaria sp. Silwood2]